MEEIWKEVSFATQYLCSNFGNVKSKRFGIILKGDLNNAGYLRVQIGSVRNRHFIHRIVAETFLQKIEGKNVVNHIDGNKLNNRAYNLEWVTPSENDNHAYNTSLKQSVKGEKHGASKLTEKQVNEIREILLNGISIAEISRKYNVSRRTIRDIRDKKTWK